MPVNYKLYTTFISSTVTWSRHDVTGKLLIWYKTTIIYSNQLSKRWIIFNSRFNCFNSLSLSSQTTVFTHLKYFHQSMDETVMFCFYFNHWFCKDDLTFARHVNIQITNMTHGYKDSDIKCIKMKNKKYHMSKHFQTFNRKIVERDTPNKQIHDRSSSWLGTRYSHKKWRG
jgi:hypothetical protein